MSSSLQNYPSKNGVYRIKIFNQNLCLESVAQGSSSTPWVRLAPSSNDSRRQHWTLTQSVTGADEWSIISAFDNTGLICKKTRETYRGHGFPYPGGESLRWKFTTVDGQYVKISAVENGTDVLDSQYRDPQGEVVHFWTPLDPPGPKQRFVFEFVQETWPLSALPTRPILPVIRPSPQPGSWAIGGTTDALSILRDVQGDVIHVFPKRAEHFIFFRIADVSRFRTALHAFQPSTSEDTAHFVCQIAQGKDSGTPSMIKSSNSQIAFTRMGMNYLGVRDATGDVRFDKFAMRDDKDRLGDQRQWDRVFDKPDPDPVNGSVGQDRGALHGVISIAACDLEMCKQASDRTKAEFDSAIQVIETIQGIARPGLNKGREHFGYKDGVSQPALRNITNARPGQIQVDLGVIIMGYKGDPLVDNPGSSGGRPAWAKGGTMMVFRKLAQDVPEFDDYLRRNGERWREFAPPGCPALTNEEGAALWGARMFGRWKSGTPLARAPYKDDPDMATNVNLNNNFDYRISGVPGISPTELTDRYCPFFAHIRKTVPRNLDPYIQQSYLESSMVIRAGIPYGPEVKDDRRAERGLLFVCYQSSLDQGFVRQTIDFAGNDFFPVTSMIPRNHGQDPIIGGPPPDNSTATVTEIPGPFDLPVAPKTGDQVNLKFVGKNGLKVDVTGFAKVQAHDVVDPPGVPQEFFVTSHGGEYFFVPAISTLKLWAAGPGSR